MLPDGFRWTSSHSFGNVLLCNERAVASLEPADLAAGLNSADWACRVDLQRQFAGGQAKPAVVVAGRDAALERLARWASANADRLRREVATVR